MRFKFLKKKGELLSRLAVMLSDIFVLLCHHYLMIYWVREYVLKEDLKLILCEDTVITIRGILLIVFSGLYWFIIKKDNSLIYSLSIS